MLTVSTDSPITFPRLSRICAAVCNWPFLTALLNNLTLIACSLGRRVSLSFCQSSSFHFLTLFQSSQAVVSETCSIFECSITNWRVVFPSSWREYRRWERFWTSYAVDLVLFLAGFAIGLLIMLSGKIEEVTDLIL